MTTGAATTQDVTTKPGGAGEPTPEQPHPGGRTRRRRGNSIAAQGEPLVWLIGGGLTVCAMMIVGLLLLIFLQGVSTFWPKRVIQVELTDGSVLLGERTRGEWFMPGVDDTSGAEMVGAEVLEETPTRERQYRQLMRTGNRDLTGVSFNWVPDAAIERESQPEWAMLIERRTWGPYMGFPQAFVEVHDREVGAEEASLAGHLTFFQGAFGALDPEERETAVSLVQQRLESLRTAEVNAFLADLASEGRTYEAVLEGGQKIAFDAVEPGANVVAVREQWTGEAEAWARFQAEHDSVGERSDERHSLERHKLGSLNHVQETARLAVRSQELEHNMGLLGLANRLLEIETAITNATQRRTELAGTPDQLTEHFGADSQLIALADKVASARQADLDAELTDLEERHAAEQAELANLPEDPQRAIEAYVSSVQRVRREQAVVLEEIDQLNRENEQLELHTADVTGTPTTLVLGEVVRAYPANQLSLTDRVGVYGSRWLEFLTENPREANQEGGVLPPIVGTIVMTLLMCFMVVPFGVLAALYLREYAKPGPIVSAVRIAVNNLAGVPSIVFGVFGLGFFCYIVGGYVDQGPTNPASPMPWMMVLCLLVVIAGLAIWATTIKMKTSAARSTSAKLLGYAVIATWMISFGLIAWLVVKTPFFEGFYAARAADGHPTFRKGGVLWASLTLALLTLPVVIVATEEALAAVPRSMREGSYACGASKWQTVRRIVLPRAMPGIMTGMILAMARGAGEVAPLMLVGAVTLAQELPVDPQFPYVHLDRSFMHLGFHIYDVGFQSPDSEGAKPMVYTTALLLVGIIATLNMAAFGLRTKLRRRFAGSQF